MTPQRLVVTEVRLSPVTRQDRQRGLLGFVRCVLGGSVLIDGVALRRTTDGVLALSFPVRRRARGRFHGVLRPLDNRARLEIERQVFAALGLAQGQGQREAGSAVPPQDHAVAASPRPAPTPGKSPGPPRLPGAPGTPPAPPEASP